MRPPRPLGAAAGSGELVQWALLVDGVWRDQWYDTRSTGGRFERMWCDTTDREMTPSNSLSLRKITVRCAHGQACDT